MMTKDEVKQSLKRIINGTTEIKANLWDLGLAQNVGHVIKGLESEIARLREQQKIHVNIIGQPSEITGVKPEQTIVDDHWS